MKPTSMWDNVCAFLRPGEVVLAWTDNESDPQYPLSQACLRYLQTQTDARGRAHYRTQAADSRPSGLRDAGGMRRVCV